MKFLDYKKVLCLSPHPDDVEYSMLGTIIKCHETSFSVLCMTKGGTKCLNTVDDNRLVEVKRAWETANASNATIYFSNCSLFEDKDRDPGWVNYIENKFIKEGNYDCILIPTKDDSMFEHRFVNGLAAALARHSPISIIEYRTPSTLNSWQPNLFINIGNFYDRKLESLDCFTSQQDKRYFTKSALDMFHMNFQCGKKGIDVVEQFKIIEIYDIIDK
jgi:LmbE family N-acetylglucosaminyl deacetylase